MKTRSIETRFLSIVLSLLMVLTMLPAASFKAYADTGSNTPLTFTAQQDNSSVTIKLREGALQYSTDGEQWDDYILGTTIQLGNSGDTVFFRGTNNIKRLFDRTHKVSIAGKVACSGNIMTLVDWQNPDNAAMVPYCFNNMFSDCTGLTTAPELPATTLANYCYNYMFYKCTGLTTAPELPATTLANYCYSSMFSGCTGLTTAPELPATTLAESCYGGMFYGCTGLKTAPKLPATTLADACYNGMFYNCIGLTTAPKLPATTLAYACYSGMFSGCTGLTTAPELPAITLALRCYYGMFSGCTGLTTAPELPATTLAESCYEGMFSGCTGIMLSTTQTEECNTEYRIPSSGEGTTADCALIDMFDITGGTFTGTPDINTTYYIKRAITHTHNYTYTASGATITATCNDESCPADEKEVKLTISDPVNKYYNDGADNHHFTLENLERFNELTGNNISVDNIVYYKGDNTTSQIKNNHPVGAEYKAKLTVGGKTAVHTYKFTAMHTGHTYGNFTANGNVITATCTNTTGTCDDPTKALTLNAPLHTVYGDGKSPEATFTGEIPGVNNPTIYYSKGDVTLASAPTDAGTYTAWCQLGNATARVEYTIAKADTAYDTTPTAKTGLVYTGSPLDLVTAATSTSNPVNIYYGVGTDPNSDEDVYYSGSIPKMINAGTYYVWYKLEGGKNYKSIPADKVEVKIEKADLTPDEVTARSATYGQTLADVTLPTANDGTWAWKDPTTTSVGNAGTHTFAAVFTPTNTNYNTVEQNVTVNVAKANMTPNPVSERNAIYEQTLADVTLPTANDGTWAWKDPTTTSVGNAGTHTFKAVFTPTNTNYNTVEQDVTVNVAKANMTPNPVSERNATYGQTLADVTLPTANDGTWAWKDPTTTSVGNAGTHTFMAVFTPTNTNYNTVEQDVTVKIAKADPTPEAVTGLTAAYGKTLEDVSLPNGWTWDAPETSVGNVGDNAFAATYTPDDTANYNTLNQDLTVTVVPVNKTALNDALTNANNYLDTIKNDADYAAPSSDLSTAISTVNAVLTNDNVTEAQVAQAITDVNNAVTTAKSDVKDIDDTKAAQAVTNKINALTAAENVSTADKTDIEAARAAYDDLTEDQKAKVSADTLEKLTNAETALSAAEKDAADQAAANDVTSAINDLPAAEDITTADKTDIEAARKAYDELTDDQKEKVSADTLEKLTDAETALAAAEKDAADQAAANDVISAINDLPAAEDITTADKTDIEAARKAYDELTDDQKAKVSAETKAKLKAAEEALVAAETPIIKGDVNFDGKINVTDIVKIAAHVKGKKLLDKTAARAADVNGDSIIDVT
uniref:dockerin type I domain-containing protein n=1 Tax=Ruminococcus sp. TaxID=41978 RepID=UPI00258B204B